jgi:hypothetical protein
MYEEVPRPVEKIGSSWVIKLDKGTRKVMDIKEVGETIIIRKKRPNEDTPSESDVESY